MGSIPSKPLSQDQREESILHCKECVRSTSTLFSTGAARLFALVTMSLPAVRLGLPPLASHHRAKARVVRMSHMPYGEATEDTRLPAQYRQYASTMTHVL